MEPGADGAPGEPERDEGTPHRGREVPPGHDRDPQDRVNVVFKTAVFPDGSEIQIQALALHTDGSAGLPGKVNNKMKATIPARILLEAAGTGAEIASPIAGSAVKELFSAAKEDLSKLGTYSITVKKDTPIEVYIVSRLEY
ncbi:MAG: TrbI/VirB10 family protein [Endomicrobiales bacterium]